MILKAMGLNDITRNMTPKTTNSTKNPGPRLTSSAFTIKSEGNRRRRERG